MNPGAWLKAEQRRRQALERFRKDHNESAACQSLREISARAPGSPLVLQDLVWFASRACEYDTARQAARGLLAAAPQNPEAVAAATSALTRFGNAEESWAAWLRLARNPAHQAFAWTSLAREAERANRMPEALEWLEKVRATYPQDAGARLLSAQLALRRRQWIEAARELHPLLHPSLPATFRFRALYLQGELCHAEGNAADAVRYWKEAKQCVREGYPAESGFSEALYRELQGRRKRILLQLKPEEIASWISESPALETPPLTLLIGHPRSGTTLLQQILASHPQVVDLDEENALACAVKNHLFLHPEVDEMENLRRASRNQMSAARRDYLRRVRMLRELSQGSHLLDKNPNLTDFSPFLLRPFPDLKILFARRDPRDVLLSCYRQAVIPDYANVSWLAPDTLAEDYSAMMAGWDCVKAALGPSGRWKEVQYEALCTDSFTTAKEATGFMGLEWHADQEQHHQRSLKQSAASPTYASVRDPLHSSSIGTWLPYQDLLPELFDDLPAPL